MVYVRPQSGPSETPAGDPFLPESEKEFIQSSTSYALGAAYLFVPKTTGSCSFASKLFGNPVSSVIPDVPQATPSQADSVSLLDSEITQEEVVDDTGNINEEDGIRENILDSCKRIVGLGLKYDSENKRGIDCSHFVFRVLGESNALPPDAQYVNTKVGEKGWVAQGFVRVDRSEEVLPGDVILFPSHVGIIDDPDAKTFYGSQTSTGPALASYDSGYWANQPYVILRLPQLVDD
ncbi:hypothetical protein K1X76_01980 [bacterium]|nr:hypothetical protein [bacterium]